MSMTQLTPKQRTAAIRRQLAHEVPEVRTRPDISFYLDDGAECSASQCSEGVVVREYNDDAGHYCIAHGARGDSIRAVAELVWAGKRSQYMGAGQAYADSLFFGGVQ